jgi:hypothetical protein
LSEWRRSTNVSLPAPSRNGTNYYTNIAGRLGAHAQVPRVTELLKYCVINYFAPVLPVFPNYFLIMSLCHPSHAAREQRTGQIVLNKAVRSIPGLLIHLRRRTGEESTRLVHNTCKRHNPRFAYFYFILTPPSRDDVLFLSLHKPCYRPVFLKQFRGILGFHRTSLGVPRKIVEEIHNYFEIPQNFRNIPRNMARIFVR